MEIKTIIVFVCRSWFDASIMEQIPPPKEVKILETAEDIQERREQVFYLEILHFCWSFM